MINIAIDGPAGSGKSTVAKLVAKRLNILYLDTGAMYRACGLKAQRMGIDCSDERGVSSFIGDIDIKIEYIGGSQHTFLEGEDVSLAIRENHVSKMASDISALNAVRVKMVEMQQAVARTNNCVLDGRDICLHVLPHAKYKYYFDALPQVRADRRVKELAQRGHTVSFDSVLSEIKQRDYNDSHREFSPLMRDAAAKYIDTSLLTAEQVAQIIIDDVVAGEDMR